MNSIDKLLKSKTHNIGLVCEMKLMSWYSENKGHYTVFSFGKRKKDLKLLKITKNQAEAIKELLAK